MDSNALFLVCVGATFGLAGYLLWKVKLQNELREDCLKLVAGIMFLTAFLSFVDAINFQFPREKENKKPPAEESSAGGLLFYLAISVQFSVTSD